MKPNFADEIDYNLKTYKVGDFKISEEHEQCVVCCGTKGDGYVDILENKDGITVPTWFFIVFAVMVVGSYMLGWFMGFRTRKSDP